MPNDTQPNPLAVQIFNAIHQSAAWQPNMSDGAARLLQIAGGLADIIGARDEKIADLEASLASEKSIRHSANINLVTHLEARISHLGSLIASLQSQVTANQTEAFAASALAHAAIHGAVAARQAAQ